MPTLVNIGNRKEKNKTVQTQNTQNFGNSFCVFRDLTSLNLRFLRETKHYVSAWKSEIDAEAKHERMGLGRLSVGRLFALDESRDKSIIGKEAHVLATNA